MAQGSRFASDVLELMRVGLGRGNENDPAATDQVLFRYLNDAVSLTMSSDLKVFEQFGTLSFTIDETNPTGIYTFNDVGAEFDFVNTSMMAYISLLDPVNNSISWNFLPIYQDPGEFYAIWGINNDEILVRGYPTMMLYYGTEMVFRTIPNVPYLVKIYGYKKNNDYPNPNTPLQFDYWLRYLAYLAMKNYAQDYRYSAEARAIINEGYARERKLMLQHTHDQKKLTRCMPQF